MRSSRTAMSRFCASSSTTRILGTVVLLAHRCRGRDIPLDILEDLPEQILQPPFLLLQDVEHTAIEPPVVVLGEVLGGHDNDRDGAPALVAAHPLQEFETIHD